MERDTDYVVPQSQYIYRPVGAEGRGPKPRFPGAKSFIAMFVLLVASILAAGGQHFYYHYLNGRGVNSVPVSQGWIIRAGNAFAFLFKTCLVMAIAVSFCQSFWYLIRRTTLKVGTLDATFVLLQNPLSFFVGDLWIRAKLLLLVAVIAWIVPISAILSPGALTVTTEPIVSVEPRTIPVLGPLETDVGFVEVGTATSYLGPTQQLLRIPLQVLSTGSIVTTPSPCGSNCSYTLSFIGPGFQCSKITAESVPPNVFPNITSAPYLIYMGATYWSGDNPEVQGLYIFRRDITDGGNFTFCSSYESNYSISVQYVENLPTTSWTITAMNQLTANDSKATQNADSIRISTAQWSALNLFAIQDAVATLLSGSVTQTGGGEGTFNVEGAYIAMSTFAQFGVGDPIFPSDFEFVVEQFLVNTTLSLNFFYQSPPILAIGASNISNPIVSVNTEATITTYPANYTYSEKTLWGIYGTALALGLLSVIIGCYTLANNGVDASMAFSQVLVTTRNRTLDDHCSGAWRGGEYIPKALMATRLRYGEVRRRESGTSQFTHPAFGFDDEIVEKRE